MYNISFEVFAVWQELFAEIWQQFEHWGHTTENALIEATRRADLAYIEQIRRGEEADYFGLFSAAA